MSRWVPIPVAVGSSLAMADLSPSARCTWLALRIAHALHGHGGVLPATVASARALPFAVPALLADIAVPDALAELAAAGLTRPHDDGLALADWDIDAEQAPCSSCRRRNPDPRHHRCPACRARDTDPTRRASRKRGADVAQTSRASEDGLAGQESQGLAAGDPEMAQTDHRGTTDVARPRPDPTRPDKTSHQLRAGARGAPASPAGDPTPQQTAPKARGDTSLRSVQSAPAARQQQSPAAGDVRAVAGAWAVEMAERGIETMRSAIHAADVGRLLAALPGGATALHVHDPDAFAAARREGWVRIIAWCPSPERLARWCVVVALRYSPDDVAGYLVVAARRGDAGTVLARHGHGERVLAQADEQALRGERADDVARLVAGGAAMRDAHVTDEERVRLRAKLADLLGRGRRDDARRVLLRLVGSDRSDVALARATDGICTLAEARRLVA